MAKIFKDTTGDSWRLSLTVGTLRDVKEQLGVDLLDSPGDMPTDLGGLVDCLWVVLFSQAQSKGLTEADFAARLDGDVIAEAVDFFMAELAAFFLKIQPSKGQAIQGIWTKTKELDQIQAEAVGSMLGALSFGSLESLG